MHLMACYIALRFTTTRAGSQGYYSNSPLRRARCSTMFPLRRSATPLRNHGSSTLLSLKTSPLASLSILRGELPQLEHEVSPAPQCS